MKKKLTSILCLLLVAVTCFSIGAMASTGLEEIQAYLNYDVTVKLDGEPQTMRDVIGNRVYPITYQGTTYVPIRAVSNMLDIEVNWDGDTKTVLLGETGEERDFINYLKPYSTSGLYNSYQTTHNVSETIAGKDYDHYIYMSSSGGGYYNLGGKFTKLTFQAYSEYDTKIYFFGDNDFMLDSFTIKASALPQEHVVYVSGVQRLFIAGENFGKSIGKGPIYIMDTHIQ